MYSKKIVSVLFVLLVAAFAIQLKAQEEEPDNRPIRPPFGTLSLIDNATTVNAVQGGLVMQISHRFGRIESISDIFGIYGGANSRIAMNYGITDRIQVGFGTTSGLKLQDFSWKYAILTQTRSNSMPISLTYYGNWVIDARSDDNFGNPDDYSFVHRFSYLTELILSKKFGQSISLQMAPSLAYFNGIAPGYENINFGLNFGARAQVLGFHSIILEYDQPLTQQTAIDVKPNLALGVEIGTSTHAFRVFVSTYNYLVKQYNMIYNENDPFGGDFQFGFNISINL
jgi:hypothetical protein